MGRPTRNYHMNIVFENRPWCYFLPTHTELGEADPYGRIDSEGRPYILQADGHEFQAKVPVGFDLSLVYPARLFVSALDDEGQDVPWDVLSELLHERLNLRPCWDEVLAWRGMKGGVLTFYKALRADPHGGQCLWNVHHWLQCRPPQGEDLQWWAQGSGYNLWLREEADHGARH